MLWMDIIVVLSFNQLIYQIGRRYGSGDDNGTTYTKSAILIFMTTDLYIKSQICNMDIILTFVFFVYLFTSYYVDVLKNRRTMEVGALVIQTRHLFFAGEEFCYYWCISLGVIVYTLVLIRLCIK